MRLKAFLTAALLLASTTPAAADETVKIAGNWAFKTWLDDGCPFDGEAVLGALKNGFHSCELIADQGCGGPDNIGWRVRQSCTARRTGHQLIITAQVEEFLRGEPTDGYRPDNFILTIQNANRMNGAMLSYGNYKAVWIREEEAIF